VRCGLEALRGNFDAVLIVLADQPLISAGDLTELISAFKKNTHGHIIIPMVNGARGNPLVLDAVAREQILASNTNLACRSLSQNQPDMVCLYETKNSHFTTDLDTLSDIAELAKRSGWKLELPEPDVSELAA
jgi:CTP:molybdopterin cytidylyltransferase MocA